MSQSDPVVNSTQLLLSFPTAPFPYWWLCNKAQWPRNFNMCISLTTIKSLHASRVNEELESLYLCALCCPLYILFLIKILSLLRFLLYTPQISLLYTVSLDWPEFRCSLLNLSCISGICSGIT